MKRISRIITAAFYLNLFLISATAETAHFDGAFAPACAEEGGDQEPGGVIVRQGDTVIALSRGAAGRRGAVAVYRKDETAGWASRRLFQRFALDRAEAQAVGQPVRSQSGPTCEADSGEALSPA